jgi:hypothetical protein
MSGFPLIRGVLLFRLYRKVSSLVYDEKSRQRKAAKFLDEEPVQALIGIPLCPSTEALSSVFMFRK